MTEAGRPGLPFAAATAVRGLGDGRYAATCDTSWSAPRGPNGGYLAALLLRAMLAEVADPAKAPRSLTCHYLRPPVSGEVELEVQLLRTGRAISTVAAHLHQDGALCVTALCAFGVDLDSALDFSDRPLPDVAPAQELQPRPWQPGMPEIVRNLDIRPAIGARVFSGAEQARTGGWLRVLEEPVLDPVVLAMYTDAWLPAAFTRLTAPSGAPTVDLTVHFRHRVPLADVPAEAHVLIDVSSAVSAEGYVEEDATLWAADGTVIAQSRQLALLRPAP